MAQEITDMKRITYISRFAHSLSPEDLQALGEVARKHNAQSRITGVLLCSGGFFFQIIEGDEAEIDLLYQKILADSRHRELVCLKTERDIPWRQFPNWSMEVINLDDNRDLLMHPIRSLIQVLAESHEVLERYTQPSVRRLIAEGINPLEVQPKREKKVVLFTDITAFSLFSARLSVEETMALVNAYCAECIDCITRAGGEVAKLMGDCVMATFDSHLVDEAIQAGLDILAALARVRAAAAPSDPLHYLYTGVGLTRGEVIEGNIGSEQKMDYTILGDWVNKAAYLEALTRRLPRALAFAPSIREAASPSWVVIHLGDYSLKSYQPPVPVYSIDAVETLKPENPQERLRELQEGLDCVGQKRAKGKSSPVPMEPLRKS